MNIKTDINRHRLAAGSCFFRNSLKFLVTIVVKYVCTFPQQLALRLTRLHFSTTLLLKIVFNSIFGFYLDQFYFLTCRLVVVFWPEDSEECINLWSLFSFIRCFGKKQALQLFIAINSECYYRPLQLIVPSLYKVFQMSPYTGN